MSTAIGRRIDRRTVLRLAGGAVGAVCLPAGGAVAPSRSGPDVVVLGAGVAGLQAARLLERSGLRVIVLEPADAATGRECPTGFSAADSRAPALLAELRLGAVDAGGDLPAQGCAYHVNGCMTAPGAWAEAASNLTVGAERTLLPTALAVRLPGLDGVLPPQGGIADVGLDPHDRPAWTRHHAAGPSFAERLREYGVSGEAARLIACHLGGEGGEAPPAAELLRRLALLRRPGGGQLLQPLGDGDRLRGLLEVGLREPVRRGVRIAGLATRVDGADIVLTEGRPLSARFVVATLPPPLVGGIPLSPELPSSARRVLDRLEPESRLALDLIVDSPYWELDGLPPGLWTDGPFGRLEIVAGSVAAPERLRVGIPRTLGTGADAASRTMTALRQIRPALVGAVRPAAMVQVPALPADPALAMASHGRIHFAGACAVAAAQGLEASLASVERAVAAIVTYA